MRDQSTIQGASTVVSSLMWLLIDQSLRLMIPWIIAITLVLIAVVWLVRRLGRR